MPDHAINPVYERIRRTGRAPTRAAALRAGCLLALIGFGGLQLLGFLAAQDGMTGQMLNQLAWLLLGLGGLAALLGPPITLMAGAGITARHARAEEMALLRLTHLSGRAILTGFVRGIRFRLRLLRAICLGLGLGIGFGLQAVGAVEMLHRRPEASDTLLMAAIFMAEAWLVFATRAAAGLGTGLGIRGGRGMLAAGVMAAALLALPALATLYALNRSPLAEGAASLLIGLVILLAAVLIAQWAVTRAAAHTIDTAQGVMSDTD